jgi:hypothetical protein
VECWHITVRYRILENDPTCGVWWGLGFWFSIPFILSLPLSLSLSLRPAPCTFDSHTVFVGSNIKSTVVLWLKHGCRDEKGQLNWKGRK